MAINKINTAQLTQYNAVITAGGELHITARDGSTVLDQTIGNLEFPAILGYSTAMKNFQLYKIQNYEPEYLLVDVIVDATTAAGAQVNPK